MKKSEQIGWKCEGCVSPGLCITVMTDQLQKKPEDRAFNRPWGCTYHNKFVKTNWKELYVGDEALRIWQKK
jgi:hypothetical protein